MMRDLDSTFTVNPAPVQKKDSNNKMPRKSMSDDIEAALHNFFSNHSKAIQSNKQTLRALNEELQKANRIVIQKTEEINGLNEVIRHKDEKLQRVEAENLELQLNIKQLKCKLEQQNEKFIMLETNYDQSLMKIRHQCNELELKNQQMIEEYQEKLKKLEVDITALQKANDDYKLNIEQEINKNYEEKLNKQRLELEQKDKQIADIIAAKKQMEDEKNKIIQEQAFKITQIERISGQPITGVQGKPNVSNDMNSNAVQTASFAQPQQPMTYVAPMPTSVIRQSQNRAAAREPTNMRTRRRRHASPQVVREHSFSSDSDSDFHVAFPTLNDTINASDTDRRRHIEIPETSDSSARFDRLKRSKN